ncbi:MAG: type II toxin-antitoxin system Phd/YefM family antitoxin [Myxococcales bacterium]|nr:type II toxin-antitoxin system Phd/YefM family antitoxin [Myxococcales bacterium]
MRTVNVHEAKTHLSRLLEQVAGGESFVIARAGHPIARLSPLVHGTEQRGILGCMRGEVSVPEDFDTMGAADIALLFGSPR